jgi:hypothetical protein
MKIIVQGHEVETKEIWDIVDIEKGKTMFLNREAGFIIKITDKPDIRIGQKIPYESYPSEIAEIKSKWHKQMNLIIAAWNTDKSETQVFKI